jgi:hypothetical protein
MMVMSTSCSIVYTRRHLTWKAEAQEVAVPIVEPLVDGVQLAVAWLLRRWSLLFARHGRPGVLDVRSIRLQVFLLRWHVR